MNIVELQQFDSNKNQWITIVACIGDVRFFVCQATELSKHIEVNTPTKYRIKNENEPTYHEWLIYPEDIKI